MTVLRAIVCENLMKFIRDSSILNENFEFLLGILMLVSTISQYRF